MDKDETLVLFAQLLVKLDLAGAYTKEVLEGLEQDYDTEGTDLYETLAIAKEVLEHAT